MADMIKFENHFKTFEIEFEEQGESVEIRFNPTDPDLSTRMFEAQKIIEDKSKNIEDCKIDENGLPNTDDYIKKAKERNKIVYDAIDYAFGNKISDKIFKYNSPFSIFNGEYFILQFFNKITPLIEKIIKSEQKKASEKANKHLAKYMKK